MQLSLYFISVVSIFKVVFEVIAFLDFYLDLDLNAAPIFPDGPKNFCNQEEPLSLPMTSTAELVTTLVTMMFSLPLPWVASSSV